MKTLLTQFSEERPQLQSEIDRTTDVEQVIKLVQNQLDRLERTYISQLSVAQIRLASFSLELLQQAIATLAAAHPTAIAPPQTQPTETQTSPRLILKLSQALICLVIFSLLFSLTKTAPGAWMAIALTGVLVGLEVTLQLERPAATAPPSELPPPTLKIDSPVLLDFVADALNLIDLAVARVGSNQPSGEQGLEELPELLNFLQRLLGLSLLERPQPLGELAKLLPQILMEQGIRAQVYRSQAPQSHREYFDFEPSIDPSTHDFVTITPALLKGDRLLRRGRVIEPAYSEVGEA
ncbi:MAG: hypothetical protein ACFB4I_22875 [Cyanophyceae cyanobacterium]